jgi:hypothetical protein
VYDREQTHPALQRLGAARLDAMNKWPTPRLQTLIDEVDRGRPKLMVCDYRFAGLPTDFKSYLLRRFDHWSASVYLYAPLVAPNEPTFDVWFGGQYRIEPLAGTAVIDGHAVPSGTVLWLQRGVHRNDSAVPIRVRLIPPDADARPDAAMQRTRSLFAGVYDY